MSSNLFCEHILLSEGLNGFTIEMAKKSRTIQNKQLIQLANNVYGNSNSESMYVAAHEASHALMNAEHRIFSQFLIVINFLARFTAYISLVLCALWLVPNYHDPLNNWLMILSILGNFFCLIWCITHYIDETRVIELARKMLNKHLVVFNGSNISQTNINKYDNERYSGVKFNIFIIFMHGLVPLGVFFLRSF